MKKILLSLATIAIVGIAATGLTVSFYGDTETSTGNTFTAGSVELKVDSQSHYNGMDCVPDGSDGYWWQNTTDENDFGTPVGFPEAGTACDGTWAQSDVTGSLLKYFNFTDIKPGDHGEDTISLHVIDNDAWGQFEFVPTRDADNTCTGPETIAEDANHNDTICDESTGDGEVDENLYFTGWLDQGQVPGFQCGNPEFGDGAHAKCEADPTEGDNVYQDYEGPKFWDNTLIGNTGPFDLKTVLSAAYALYCAEPNDHDPGAADGHDNYGFCHGLASDGRMVGSTTYYFGLKWNMPLATGNEVQSDEYTADMTFRVEQFRNNSTPFSD